AQGARAVGDGGGVAAGPLDSRTVGFEGAAAVGVRCAGGGLVAGGLLARPSVRLDALCERDERLLRLGRSGDGGACCRQLGAEALGVGGQPVGRVVARDRAGGGEGGVDAL